MNDIKSIAVIGTGTMGRGIAQVAAAAGYETRLFDANPAAAESALKAIAANLAKGVEKGKVTTEQRAATLANLRSAATPADAAQAGLIIEAVPEDLALKQKLFSGLHADAPAETIFASNTSSLSIARIAAGSGRPEQFIGMHFFNPVHLMPLLEIVHHAGASPATLSAALVVGKKMGKHCIQVKDSPGFASSRLGVAIGLEAMRMLEEGVASAADIDAAMELGYRHPMGPLKLTDLVGLDVRLAIADYLCAELGNDRFKAPAILREKVAAGKLGKKSGEGFYRWEGDEIRKGEDRNDER